MFAASKLPRLVLRSPSFRTVTLSAVEGARDPPLDNRTLPEYFSAKVVSRRPDQPALICRQERPRTHGGPLSRNMGVEGRLAWDFSEFDRHIKALARGLVGLGVKKGDRVGVVMGNTRYACPTVSGRCSSFSQRVCNAAMGMCEHRSNPRYHESRISLSRDGGLA
jgi:acyl-CoA synthetase (AMP-forming)/AMP-acid ligase II